MNKPVEAVTSDRAWKGNGQGGVQIAVGADITNDPIFEPNGNGGIQLKLSS